VERGKYVCDRLLRVNAFQVEKAGQVVR